jgi:hypothetical protein
MSIIVSFFNNHNAFVFSEGRLTSNKIDDDNYDKTVELVKDKVIAAFCGMLVFDRGNAVVKADQVLRELGKQINMETVDSKDLLKVLKSTFSYLLSITKPQQNRNFVLHLIRKLPEEKGNSYEFFYLLITNDPNDKGKIIVIKEEIEPLSDLKTFIWKTNGDDCGLKCTDRLLNKEKFIDDKDDIINKVSQAIIDASECCGKLKNGESVCGKNIFSKVI